MTTRWLFIVLTALASLPIGVRGDAKGQRGRKLTVAPASRLITTGGGVSNGIASGLTNWKNLACSLSCPPPTASQCLDRDYAQTCCGKAMLNGTIAGMPNTCAAACAAHTNTAADCRSSDFVHSLCGQLERYWVHESYPSSSCRPFVLQAWQNEAVTAPVAESLVPAETIHRMTPGMLDEETLAHPSEPRHSPHRGPYSRAGQSFNGFTTHYFGRTMKQFTHRGAGDAAYIQSANLQHLAWEANGNAVGSCTEYVFEKYYDYNLFEQAIAPLGSDYRAVFNVAFDPDDTKPTSIGTRGANGSALPLNQRDGTPNVEQIRLGGPSEPKNVYFGSPALNEAERSDLAATWVATPDLPRPVTILGIYIQDDALYAKLRSGQHPQYEHDETWAWHQQRSDELAPLYLDEQLYSRHEKNEAFLQLLFQRDEIIVALQQAFDQFIASATPDGWIEAVVNPSIYEALLTPVVPATPISRLLTSERAARDARRSGLGLQNLQVIVPALIGLAPKQMALKGQAPGGLLTALGGRGFNAALLHAAVSQSSNVLDTLLGNTYDGYPHETYLDTITRLLGLLSQQDAKIEAALADAVARGCLELIGPNACDWSPKLLAQHLYDPFTVVRERDFQKCNEVTATAGFERLYNPAATFFYPDPNDFTLQKVTRIPPGTENPCYDDQGAPGPACDLAAYNTSPTTVERFFDCVDRNREDLLCAISDILGGADVLDPENPHQIKISRSASDSAEIGDDDFGVTFSYEGSFGLGDLPAYSVSPPPDYCSLTPSLTGNASVDARVFGEKINMFRAAAAARTDGPSFATLEIVGMELIDEGPETWDVGQVQGVNLIEDAESLDEEFFSYSQTIIVVVVPVTLRAGLAGQIGAGVSLGIGSPAEGKGCQAGDVALKGTFRPSLGVKAFASASLDAFIAEAGLKVELVIINLEFPLTIALQMASGPVVNTEPTVTAKFSTNLDLVTTMLAGRVLAFVEYCFDPLCAFSDEYEATIFDWDGLSSTTNLFHTEATIPLHSLVRAQESL
ncbi:MAG: hypothetical protein IT384_23385 [Deltaproteobacteria bacterium]|nr:hypothetical protein [Deltaproteobacteria bacterium]